MTAVYLPLVLLLFKSYDILVAVGVEEAVSAYSYEYMLPMIPSLYMIGLYDLIRRFLTSVQHPSAPMIAQVTSAFIHIFLCIKLVH